MCAGCVIHPVEGITLSHGDLPADPHSSTGLHSKMEMDKVASGIANIICGPDHGVGQNCLSKFNN